MYLCVSPATVRFHEVYKTVAENRSSLRGLVPLELEPCEAVSQTIKHEFNDSLCRLNKTYLSNDHFSHSSACKSGYGQKSLPCNFYMTHYVPVSSPVIYSL